MSDMSNVLKAVQRKFPVCTLIDARSYNSDEVNMRNTRGPNITEVSAGGKKYNVSIRLGSFNVYVIKIEESE